jgi:hypothetical protein
VRDLLVFTLPKRKETELFNYVDGGFAVLLYIIISTKGVERGE